MHQKFTNDEEQEKQSFVGVREKKGSLGKEENEKKYGAIEYKQAKFGT